MDRRTGAVVHLSAARGTADAASFPVGTEDAIAAARAAVGEEHRPTAVAGDTWHAGRWTVTIDRGLSGRAEALFRDIERLETDARTRAVPGRRGAYGIDADRSLPVAEGVPRTVTRYRYGGEVAIANVEEAPSGAAPGGTPPAGIRTSTMSRTTHEASIPDPYIDAPGDGIGRESGNCSEYRFSRRRPGDGVGDGKLPGRVRDTSRPAESLHVHTEGYQSDHTPQEDQWQFLCTTPTHHNWSGFLRPVAAE
ncbi:hypothetical protein OHS70_21310 [Streptomyces sp. NBC_00390]|uniref:hypothetical protein n=1 Tax=Streptomyces sp. NBC_00390 TaxID=2975736 RepID=UPI002E1E4E33